MTSCASKISTRPRKKEDRTHLILAIKDALPLGLLLPPLPTPLLLIQIPLLLLLPQRSLQFVRLVLEPPTRLEVRTALLLELGGAKGEGLDLLVEELGFGRGGLVLDAEFAEAGFGRCDFLRPNSQR